MRKQIKIYIYSDQDDYVKNGGQAIWSHGVAFAQAKTIKIYPEVSGFFDTILPHELGHIIFRDYIGFTAVIPLWFEEGVAIYQEKAKRLGSNGIVKEAIENGQFIPLSQLTGVRLYKDSKDQMVDLFYTESASVVYYMITELGEQEFYMLCNELKNNTPFQEALHKVYLRFKTIDDLKSMGRLFTRIGDHEQTLSFDWYRRDRHGDIGFFALGQRAYRQRFGFERQ